MNVTPRSRLLGAAVFLTLLGCAGAAAPGPAPAQTGDRVYVVSQEAASVGVLDAATGDLLATVDLTAMGYPAASKPHHVAVEPDGSHWYVSLIAAGKVLKLDRENRLVAEVDFETPGLLALDPTSDLLYVGRSMAAVNPPQRLGMLDRATMEMEQVDVFFPRPHALAVDPAGDRLFAASLAENRMAWAPLGVEEVDLMTVDGALHTLVQFAVSPDGRWLVAGGQMTGTLLVWDITGEEPELRHTLELGGQPWHPSFTPDGSELWVPRRTADAVTVVDAGSWTVEEVLEHPALVEPHGSAVSPDGRRVFVASRNTSGAYGSGDAPGTVVTFDRESREVVNVVEVGHYAAGMAAPMPWLRR
jgi:DNA-binding beta-propeller fold protein YncE